MFDPYVMAEFDLMIPVGSGLSVFYLEPIVSTLEKQRTAGGYAFTAAN
jgi:hypothetical protein